MTSPEGDWFIDTNVLLRLSRRTDPAYPPILAAFSRLRSWRAQLYCTPQVIAEFWNVSTRPVERNGFGSSIPEVEADVQHLDSLLTVLPETEAVYAEWRQLVRIHEVRGVQVHDARIAAAMRAYGIPHLLTLNGKDFQRYSGFRPIAPAEVVG